MTTSEWSDIFAKVKNCRMLIRSVYLFFCTL